MAKPIHSTGPVPCRLMCVAERPGIVEARTGYVLCGPSGEEFDRFLLTESGIDRSNIHCCNLVRDYRDGANPEEWEVTRDGPLLVEEIQQVQPKYIMAMGLWSARAFLGPDVELEWASGLHFPLKSGRVVMPVIHTAATLHNVRYGARCAEDFRNFGKLVRGEALPTGHLSPQSQCHYSDDVISIAGADTIAMDTEGDSDHPWGLSYSVRPGQAAVQHGARKHRKWNCTAVQNATVVLHGAMHDLPVLQRLGVRPVRWECTLLKAALLGTEPHSLKALARRHCGMRMREYSDVVRKAEREIALSYLSRVIDWAHAMEDKG